MAGQIKIMCCQGKSKDNHYPFYPYWRLKVIGDDGKEATVTITYEQLEESLKKILLHEFRVDQIRKRNPEYVKYKQLFRDSLIRYYEQLELTIFDIPEIYTVFKGMGSEEEL